MVNGFFLDSVKHTFYVFFVCDCFDRPGMDAVDRYT